MKFGVKTNLKCEQFYTKINVHQSKYSNHNAASSTIAHSKGHKITTSSETNKIQGFVDSANILQRILWPVFIFVLLNFLDLRIEAFGALAKPITPAEHKYEEYYIEHEISSTQAKNSVMTYNSNSLGPPPGCQDCTEEEIQYCGSSLMNDHCCCDKEYFEKLPYIPHTCYLGAQPCTPFQDCATYAKLRDCCCNNILIKKWKAKNSAKLPEAISLLQLLIIILFINVLTLDLRI